MSETYSDVIFQLILAVCGVQTGFRQRKWVKCVSTCLYVLTLISIPFCSPYSVYKTFVSARRKPLSLSAVISNLSSVSYVAISIYVFHMLVNKERRIEPLLRRRGRHFKSYSLFLIGLLQNLMRNVIPASASNESAYKSSFSAAERFGYARCDLVTSLINAIYFDVSRELLGRLCRVRESSGKVNLNWNILITEKWKIRDQVSEINSLFAGIFAALYLHLFLSIGFIWGRVVRDNMSFSGQYPDAFNIFWYALQLYFVARAASDVKAQCAKTEAELLRRLRGNVDCTSIRQLRFREDWDSLRVGCFEHSKANFLKFLSTVTTCVAIVLQFDYLVVRAINELSQRGDL